MPSTAILMSAVGDAAWHAHKPEEARTLCGLLHVVDSDSWYVDDDSIPPPRSADATGKRYYDGGNREMCGRCETEAIKVRQEVVRMRQVGTGMVGFPLAKVISLFSKRKIA
jgi:hypothetical protein